MHRATVRLDRRQPGRLRAMLDEIVQFLAENDNREVTESISLTTVLSMHPNK